MNTQIASFLQGTVVGALVTVLAAIGKRGNTRRILNGTPVRFSEGSTIRGNGNSGPSTPKPPISFKTTKRA